MKTSQKSIGEKRVFAKKSLGQNFLTDTAKAERIAQAMEAKKGDSMLEIGPGCGDLTQFLLQTGANVHAIEIDTRAIDILEDVCGDHPNFTVEQGDFLKFDIKEYAERFLTLIDGIMVPQLKIAGNIPYYITSDILFRLFEHADVLERAVIMMQKEVAERICSEPRTKEYGILSIAARFVSKPKIVLKVPAGCFTPRPNVDSAVVYFDFTARSISMSQLARVHPLVRTAFSQRRKVLSNALKPYLSNYHQDLPEHIIGMLKKRAEELLPIDFMMLADLLVPQQS